MDLKDLWDATVGEYVRWDLWPAYLSAVLVWGLTSPLRDVGVAFALQVWRVTHMNGDLWRLSALRYHDMITNEELRGLDGPTYAYALWNGLFAVPALVLRDRQEEYGRYAYVLRSWWTAYRVTYGEYLPCLTVLTFRSVGRYVCAFGEAIAAMWSRCYEFGEGGFWIAVILVSLSLFLPMALYDALEYVSCGPVGLFLLLLLFNALNLAFSWTDSYVIVSLIIVGIGLFSHGWHLCAESTVMRRVTPVALATNALDSVQRNAALRVRTEHANAERLRAPDSDPLEDYPADDGGTPENETLEEGERPHSEASPPDILEDFTANSLPASCSPRTTNA
ncbi:hypothetical protein F443_22527 [Phytophthora nicotianae P1569]|uniref:Uncharacterized protein n=1 Tax=Phytophthora nicotianae P1569 TaxID=1317065 RepID=V9DUQ2_PHYNI|nr:hypothetical protein F443_22527 [Phytophthora nicotianae P1569]